jgi:hypothetical protein
LRVPIHPPEEFETKPDLLFILAQNLKDEVIAQILLFENGRPIRGAGPESKEYGEVARRGLVGARSAKFCLFGERPPLPREI